MTEEQLEASNDFGRCTRKLAAHLKGTSKLCEKAGINQEKIELIKGGRAHSVERTQLEAIANVCSSTFTNQTASLYMRSLIEKIFPTNKIEVRIKYPLTRASRNPSLADRPMSP